MQIRFPKLRALLAVLLFLCPVMAQAQLPTCDKIYYLTAYEEIYTYDPSLPVSFSNPSLNSIATPGDGFFTQTLGLTVGEVLGSGSSTLTFYATVYDFFGFLEYYYYNPVTSTWVNTGHLAGSVNIAEGGGYIFNLDGSTGDIYRYDGTGDDVYMGTVPGFAGQGPFDLIADCAGNWYILNATGDFTTPFMYKYDANGVFLQSWTISNPSGYYPSAGFAIAGSSIYMDDYYGGGIASGSVGATVVSLTSESAIVPFGFGEIYDLGSCAGAVPVIPTVDITATDTTICPGTPVTFTAAITAGGTAPVYRWFVNSVLVIGATGSTYTYSPANGDAVMAELVSNAVCASIDSVYSNIITIDVGGSVIPTSLNISICQGQTYVFGGTSYSVAGSYMHTFTTAGGCDSDVTLVLTVNPVYNNSVSASICTGQTYTWGGTTYSTTGTYTHLFASVNGCDSNVSLDLTVSPAITDTIDISICSGNSYTFNGTAYTTAGTYSATFTSSGGCDSIVTLNLTLIPVYNNTFDTAICQGASINFGGTLYSAAGNYPHTFFSVFGCDSIVTLNLTVNPTYNISFSATICENSSYTWAGTTYTTAGAYTQSFFTTLGCDSTVTLNLFTNDTAHTDISASICSGQSYLFNGTAYTTAGVYTANLTTSNGCDSNVVLTLTVNSVLNTSITANICAGQSYSFGGTSYSASGTYADTMTSSGGCDSIITLDLTVAPALSSSLDVTICEGQSYSFAGNTYTATGSYPVVFTTGSGCDSTATLNLTVTPLTVTNISAIICPGTTYDFNGTILSTAGTYTDTSTTMAGCDSVTILNLSTSSVVLTPLSATICTGSSYVFDGSTITVAGVYTDSLTGAGGCDSVVTLTLSVVPSITTNISGAICQGSVYFFNGVPLGVAGNYSDTLSSTTGCDSVVNLSLVVNPVFNQDIFSTICDGQTYVFGGVYYYTSGTYSFPFINGNGCDSTIVLHLTVLAPITTELYDTICNGQSFSYNGALYSSTGDYPSVFTSFNSGCDSTVTLHLLVLPVTPPPAVADTVLCQGTTSPTLSVPGTGIIWYATEFGPSAISPPVPPTTVPDTITYYVSQTISGCESQRVPLVVTVLPKPLAPLVNTPVIYCSGVLADSLHYSVLTSGYDSLIWYPASTGTAVIPEPVPVTTIADTFNYWVAQVVEGCASNRSAIEVDVKTTLPAPVVVSPLEYCQYSYAPPLTATLADTSASLLWYNSGSTFGSPVTPSPDTDTPSVTTWTVTQTLAGCESAPSSITVTIKVKPAPPLVNSLQTYCQGSNGGSVNLFATGANLLWYTVAGGGTGTPLAPSVSTGIPDTVNWYVSQTVNGCESDRALITVRVLAKPDATIAIDRNPACQFDTLTLSFEGTAPPGADYYWTMSGAQIISPAGGTNIPGPFAITYNTPGNYTISLIVNNHGCSSESEIITLNVKPIPELQFVLPEIGCTGIMQDVILNNTTAGIDETYTWDFAGGTIIFGAGGGPYGVVWTDTGWHTVTATVSADGCTSLLTEDSIQIAPTPVADILTTPGTVCTLDSITLLAQTAAPGDVPYTYHWTPAEWIADSSIGPVSIIRANGSGWIYLEVESAPGCIANDSIFIQTQSCCTVAMPMAFTPNGDGLNDVFRVITQADQQVIFFRIVNRWGQQVFETHEENNGWDGTFNSQPQDMDTYYYILQYTCADGSMEEKSGDVILVR